MRRFTVADLTSETFQPVGRGAQANVSKATMRFDDKEELVALKRPVNEENIMEEVLYLSKLKSPHIVKVRLN